MGLISSSSVLFLVMFFIIVFFAFSSAAGAAAAAIEDETVVGEKQQKLNLRSKEEVMGIFESWLVKHGKSYDTVEEKHMRFQIFRDGLNGIDKHNAENHPSKQGLNHFSDLTREEVLEVCCGFDLAWNTTTSKTTESNRYVVRGVGKKESEFFDWRESEFIH